ncbi:MAG TPA: DUF2239 domain-containing protein [Myxococcales bacterium]|jgi:hypothetical protein|nr:DUF2239 domain-containing protein [Myxococcales bacterium]
MAIAQQVGGFTAFAGHRLIASGTLEQVIRTTKERLDAGESERIAFFEDETGMRIDIDFRGTPDEVLARLSDHPVLGEKLASGEKRAGPGRPKLGVVSREVSLLPRHWSWLGEQPSGASAALRKLVEEAMKRSQGEDLVRKAKEAAHRVMWEMAGDFPGFEEVSRAFFAGDHGAVRASTRVADLEKQAQPSAPEA